MGQMEQRQTDPTQEINRPGQIAESAVGQVGQRQTATAIDTGPMGRVNTRIQNRVQNRIRNRIDRSYDPTANATSPFEVAAEQTTRGQSAQLSRPFPGLANPPQILVKRLPADPHIAGDDGLAGNRGGRGTSV